MSTTVRDLVKGYQHELRHAVDLQPKRAAEMLAELSALTGNVLEEIREADAAYRLKLMDEMAAQTKANRARIVAETSPEFARRQEARDVRELVQEMIGSLKYFLRAKEEELRDARYQK